MESWFVNMIGDPGVTIPLCRKVYIGLINNIVSDSKRRINSADHKFLYGIDKSAGTFFILYIHGY
jgi:hypothetical protein